MKILKTNCRISCLLVNRIFCRDDNNDYDLEETCGDDDDDGNDNDDEGDDDDDLAEKDGDKKGSPGWVGGWRQQE